jgi:hypothetical protein
VLLDLGDRPNASPGFGQGCHHVPPIPHLFLLSPATTVASHPLSHHRWWPLVLNR